MARTSRVKPANIARKAEIKTTAIKPRSSHGGISFGPRPFGSTVIFRGLCASSVRKIVEQAGFSLNRPRQSKGLTMSGVFPIGCETTRPAWHPYQRVFSRVYLSLTRWVFSPPLLQRRVLKYGCNSYREIFRLGFAILRRALRDVARQKPNFAASLSLARHGDAGSLPKGRFRQNTPNRRQGRCRSRKKTSAAARQDRRPARRPANPRQH